MDTLNQLTIVGKSGTLTVGGTTTSPATNVNVNGLTATRYGDNTFSKEGFTLVDGYRHQAVHPLSECLMRYVPGKDKSDK